MIVIAANIALYPAELYERGLDVITCGTRRTSPAALSPEVKSLNYLNNIMAKLEAKQAGAGEGLMLNEQGYVAECTGDNIFVIKRREGTSRPPFPAPGVWLREQSRAPWCSRSPPSFGTSRKCTEPAMTTGYDLYTADECFLTGTAAEIIPVVTLDKRPIGNGKPGPADAPKFIATDSAS